MDQSSNPGLVLSFFFSSLHFSIANLEHLPNQLTYSSCFIIIFYDTLRSADHSLNVTLVNHILRIENVTVTLQWPREAGAVYHISVSQEIPHTEFTTSDHIFVISLTISYNIQYNVSIVSSLCGVTTTKVLNYGKYKQ